MTETLETGVQAASARLGALARDYSVRILNFSPSGCLIETNARLEVGTIGTLWFDFDGRELADDIEVVRCQPIEGAGSLYQVGARFLWTIAPGKGTLRFALGHVLAEEQESKLVG